jgi:hypothetical protein
MPHERNQRRPVAEDHPDRPWEPCRKCREEVQVEILELIMDAGWRTFRTLQVTEALSASHPEWRYGTCSAYVSGALLAFREAGWVRSLGRTDNTYLWEVDA